MSTMAVTLLLFGTFFLLLAVGVPIAIGISVAAFASILMILPPDQAIFVVMQKMNTGLESFTLLAIPLFILAGNIMNNGGIAKRLIALAELVTGRVPGSLVHTNIVGNMLFGALSGSAVAAAAAIGGTMSKQQRERGYDPAFTAAANIASAPSGLLIPPTTAFIVYSMIAGGTSIAALFMAGAVPGILMGLTVIAVALVYAIRKKYPTSGHVSAAQAGKTILEAIPALLLIVIVVGGIVAGIFNAT